VDIVRRKGTKGIDGLNRRIIVVIGFLFMLTLVKGISLIATGADDAGNRVAHMSIVQQAPAAVEVGGRVYTVGGLDETNLFATLEMLESISNFASARVIIQISSTSDHTNLQFSGEETLEELDKRIIEGEDLILADGHHSVDEKSVSWGSVLNIQERRLIRLVYTIGLYNLERDTSIPLKLGMGCIGWSNVKIFNYNLGKPILIDERNTTICTGVDYSISDNAFLADSDNDGLGDGEEVLTYGSDPTLEDSDGDGLSDGIEVIEHQTSPTSTDTDEDGMPDKWEVNYQLEPTNALDAGFDPDRDGLTNIEEYAYQTNPNKWDTDGDGMEDGWEVKYALNPLDASDFDEDPDGDDLINLKEYQKETDPNDHDTDDDGIPDGIDKDPLDPGVQETTIVETEILETTVVETRVTETTKPEKTICMGSTCLSLQEWSYVVAIIAGLAAVLGWLIRIKRRH